VNRLRERANEAADRCCARERGVATNTSRTGCHAPRRPPRASRAGCRKRAGTPGGTPRRDVAGEPREQTVSGVSAGKPRGRAAQAGRRAGRGCAPCRSRGGAMAARQQPGRACAGRRGPRRAPRPSSGRHGRTVPRSRAGEPRRHGGQDGRKAAPKPWAGGPRRHGGQGGRTAPPHRSRTQGHARKPAQERKGGFSIYFPYFPLSISSNPLLSANFMESSKYSQGKLMCGSA
jgi:hypothetical protein